MWMHRARPLVALIASSSLALAAAAACSSFGEDASPADAAAPAPALDGASPDAAPPLDAAIDAACPSFATFCDDFEVGDLRRWGGAPNIVPPSAFAVDDGGPPHRGGYALHFTTQESKVDGAVVYSSASIRSRPFPAPVAAGTIAVRFYVLGPTIPSTGTTLVWLTKGTNDEAEAILMTSYGQWAASALAGSLGAGTNATSAVTFAPARWICAEWVLDVGTSGRQQLFIDGSVEAVLTQEMDTIGDLTQGYQYASIYMNNQGPATQELFFDDVAVAVLPTRADGPRIGCIP